MREMKLLYAACFVICGRETLILQRKHSERDYADLWEIPSGRVKPGESLSDACLREVREETGLSLRTITPVSIMEYWKNKHNTRIHCVQVNFATFIRPPLPPVRMSSEHQRLRWVSWTSYGTRLVSPELHGSWKQASAYVNVLTSAKQRK